MKNTYKITATTLRTTSPLTVAQHDGARMPMANPHFLPEGMTAKAKDFAAREAVETVPFFIVANDDAPDVRQYGRPYVPATSLRGRLRSLSVMVITEGMKGTISGPGMALLSVGGQKMKKAKNGTRAVPKTTASAAALGHGLPIFGLFGLSVPEFLKGFNVFSHMVSKGSFNLQRSGIVRQHYLNQNRSLIDLMTPEGVAEASAAAAKDNEQAQMRKEAKAEVRAALKAASKAATGSDEDTIAREALAKANAEADQIEASTDVAMGQLHGKWLIPAGVDFDFEITHEMTDEELGLLVLTLQRFADQPTLGGDKGRGAGGNFEVEFEVTRLDQRKWTHVGNVGNLGETNGLDSFIKAFNKKLPAYQKTLTTI